MLGNFGMDKLFLILIIVLVLFGARRVPEIGASFGKGIREFKRNIRDADRQIREPMRDAMRSNDRVGAGDPMAQRREDTERPEPKRLL